MNRTWTARRFQALPRQLDRGCCLDHRPRLRAPESVSLLRDHNLTPSRGTGDCKGDPANVSSRGNKGTFVLSTASSVFLFWLLWGASVTQDAVTLLVTSFIVNDSSFCCEENGGCGKGAQVISQESLLSSPGSTILLPHHSEHLNFFFFNPLSLSFFLISCSVVHLEAHGLAPAFRVEFKSICIILHGYCVIVGVVVAHQEASLSSPSTRAFGRFRALWALSRGALGSSLALPSRPPPPALPISPPCFSAPPPRPLSAALEESQARVSRRG